jgi:hypothetical protein
MSAANTLTFEEIVIGVTLFQGAAIIIHRLEYDITSTNFALMTTAGDNIDVAITSDSSISTLSISQESVIDRMRTLRVDYGAAASGELIDPTFKRDFTDLPGGGLLVPPKPLYFAMTSGGLASAASMVARMYFSIIELKSDQYLELLETRRAFS